MISGVGGVEEEAREEMNVDICGEDGGKLNRGIRENRLRVDMRTSFCKQGAWVRYAKPKR